MTYRIVVSERSGTGHAWTTESKQAAIRECRKEVADRYRDDTTGVVYDGEEVVASYRNVAGRAVVRR